MSRLDPKADYDAGDLNRYEELLRKEKLSDYEKDELARLERIFFRDKSFASAGNDLVKAMSTLDTLAGSDPYDAASIAYNRQAVAYQDPFKMVELRGDGMPEDWQGHNPYLNTGRGYMPLDERSIEQARDFREQEALSILAAAPLMIRKSMKKSMIYVSFDGDGIGNKVAAAEAMDNEAELKRVSVGIQAGENVMEQWALSVGGEVVEAGGDEGLMKVPERALLSLEHVRERYAKVVGATLTVGVGRTISQCTKARMLGKLTGKNKIVQYDINTEQGLRTLMAGQQSEVQKIENSGVLKSNGRQNMKKAWTTQESAVIIRKSDSDKQISEAIQKGGIGSAGRQNSLLREMVSRRLLVKSSTDRTYTQAPYQDGGRNVTPDYGSAELKDNHGEQFHPAGSKADSDVLSYLTKIERVQLPSEPNFMPPLDARKVVPGNSVAAKSEKPADLKKSVPITSVGDAFDILKGCAACSLSKKSEGAKEKKAKKLEGAAPAPAPTPTSGPTLGSIIGYPGSGSSTIGKSLRVVDDISGSNRIAKAINKAMAQTGVLAKNAEALAVGQTAGRVLGGGKGRDAAVAHVEKMNKGGAQVDVGVVKNQDAVTAELIKKGAVGIETADPWDEVNREMETFTGTSVRRPPTNLKASSETDAAVLAMFKSGAMGMDSSQLVTEEE